MKPPIVLFLCSGNYYRSRYAEIVFNDLAQRHGLAWRAESRGLAVGRHHNIGPISPYALEGLRVRGLESGADARFPAQVTTDDLRCSALVVALKEAEHRPLLMELFPDWVECVEFWHIHDLDCAQPCETLACLEAHLQSLVERLATHSS